MRVVINTQEDDPFDITLEYNMKEDSDHIESWLEVFIDILYRQTFGYELVQDAISIPKYLSRRK